MHNINGKIFENQELVEILKFCELPVNYEKWRYLFQFLCSSVVFPQEKTVKIKKNQKIAKILSQLFVNIKNKILSLVLYKKGTKCTKILVQFIRVGGI